MRLRALTLLTLLPVLAATEPVLAQSQGDQTPRYDIVLRNGTVIDGTGRPGSQADVGIRDGHVAALGDLSDAKAGEVVDVTGLVVCPGFIDLHSHADRGILEYRAAENYIRQGATTLVCGNCGSSPVDVRKFFAELRDGGTGPNIALLIGHGSVRREVLGMRNAAPNDDQLRQMQALVRQAMQDGAVGMSTGLRYSPGAYAETKEIVALAKVVASHGGFYATHMRDEGTRMLEALQEALQIGREAGVPVHISHHKISSAAAFGLTRLSLAEIDRAREKGLDVSLDQYPYGAGSGGMSLYVPQASLAGGVEAYRKRIADPKQRAEIVAGVEELLRRKIYETSQSPDNPEHTAVALARVQIARAKHDRTLEGKTVTDILRARKQDVTLRNGAEVIVELVGHGVQGINHTLDARPGGDVDRVMRYPLTCVASDGAVFAFGEGNPHPRSYGCFPRVLGHYVRERKLLSLEQAIHKMTALPAHRLGWTDRGVVKPGAWADLVVFDPKTIADKGTFADPHQYAVGVKHTLVRGELVLKSGKMTNRLPGRPVGLTRPKSTAAASH